MKPLIWFASLFRLRMKKSLAVFLILFSLIQMTAEVSLNQIAEVPEYTVFWEPYRNTGVICLGNHSVVFKPEMPWALGDYQVPIPSEIREGEGGEIFLSETTVDYFKRYLEGRLERQGPSISTIVIDPGHGGRDPGAIGTHGFAGNDGKMFEKDVTLNIAQILSSMMSLDYPDTNIILTRDDDTYLTLENRTDIANNIETNDNEAIIFISIHVNASFNSGAKGFEVWYLPTNFRRDLLTESEKADLSDDLMPLFNAMKEDEFSHESIYLARAISEGMDDAIGDFSVNRGLKEENFFVVRNSRMPAVLIETGFISNPTEAAQLLDLEYLQNLASGIYNGIRTFIEDFESSKGFTE